MTANVFSYNLFQSQNAEHKPDSYFVQMQQNEIHNTNNTSHDEGTAKGLKITRVLPGIDIDPPYQLRPDQPPGQGCL